MNRFLARLAINSAAILIASAAGCVAMVFVIVAVYLGFTEILPPWGAALSTAGVALLFAVLVLLIGRMMSRSTVPPGARNRHRSAAELGELMGRQAHELLAGNSLGVLGLLLGVGFAMGFSPRLRKFLMKIL